MAGYERQEAANIVDDEIISASNFNNEYNAIEQAFNSSTGHKHDGTTAEGATIDLVSDDDGDTKIQVEEGVDDDTIRFDVLGTEQFIINDGAIVPTLDNDIDLGSVTKEFKDLHLDGTANIDSLVADTVDINAGTVDNTVIGGTTPAAVTATTVTTTSNVSVTGNITVTGTVDGRDVATDGTTQDSHIAATSGVHGATGTIVGTTDTQTLTNKTLTSPNIDTPDLDGGTIDGATIATSDITVGAGKTLNVSAGTLILDNNQISGNSIEGGTIGSTTITTLTSTTGNITTTNSTTVDTTNLQVSSIKAKDGTAAGSIANSTGVVSISNSVLTSTDINSGTIDNTVIGDTIPLAGTFTTLTSTGNINVGGTVDGRDIAADGAVIDALTGIPSDITVTSLTADSYTINPEDASSFLGVGTVVDAVVYDTANDTDGGLWRNRCQDTSWYQEVVGGSYLGSKTTVERDAIASPSEGDLIYNTSTGNWEKYIADNTLYVGEHYGDTNGTWNATTRGIRAEFPAVAAVIAEASKVWIFDVTGSEPVLWRVLNGTSISDFPRYTGDINTIDISAGIIAIGTASTGDLNVFNLVADEGYRINSVGKYAYLGGFAYVNETMQYGAADTAFVIVNREVNDVAITTLPNAAIDPATGLPYPTIACLVGDSLVATEDGLVPIKDITVGTQVHTSEGLREVLNHWNQGVKDTIELEFDTGDKLVCTPDHKIKTTQGWVDAGSLTTDMEIISL